MPDASGRIALRSSHNSQCVLEELAARYAPEPVWHTVPARKEQREAGYAWSHERWKPSVYKVLDALHGTRGRVMDEQYWYQTGGQKFPRYEIDRPALKERKNRFLQALGIAYAFRQWEDLMPIAVHRRQVTNVGGLREIDEPFYVLVALAVADRFFRPKEIVYLAERMPSCSAIREMLYRLAVCELKRQIRRAVGSVTD